MDSQQYYFDRPHSNIALKERDVERLESFGFSAKEVLGRGAFALVFKVGDGKGKIFAIKKQFVPKERVGRVSAFESVPPHPNVLRLLRVLQNGEFVGSSQLSYEVYEQYDMNLQQLIDSLRTHRIAFPRNLLRHIIVSLLRGLAHLHSHRIIHRDLKPSNVLLKFGAISTLLPLNTLEEEMIYYNDDRPQDVQVVISDLNHVIGPEEVRATTYVSTRMYRAPELLLGFLNYSSSVDMWALGCVIGEMIRLQPLFPGDSGLAVLCTILTTLGTIDPLLVERYTGKKLQLFPVSRVQPIEFRANGDDPIVFELMKALLDLDDRRRPAADISLSVFLRNIWLESCRVQEINSSHNPY